MEFGGERFVDGVEDLLCVGGGIDDIGGAGSAFLSITDIDGGEWDGGCFHDAG